MPRKKVVHRVPHEYNAGTMTKSQYFGKIRSALRSAFRYWKPMTITLDKASRPYKGTNNRIKKEYQCANCRMWFQRKDVEIDHIIPAGSLKEFEDIVPFIKRLTEENPQFYQILCKKICHLEKTKLEKQNNKNEL